MCVFDVGVLCVLKMILRCCCEVLLVVMVNGVVMVVVIVNVLLVVVMITMVMVMVVVIEIFHGDETKYGEGDTDVGQWFRWLW